VVAQAVSPTATHFAILHLLWRGPQGVRPSKTVSSYPMRRMCLARARLVHEEPEAFEDRGAADGAPAPPGNLQPRGL